MVKTDQMQKQEDLLLFQMDNTIIASAVLNDIIPFSKPTIDGNNGAYVVNKQSVKVFKPIDKNELQKIITNFKHFSHTKQKFDEKEVNMKLLYERMDTLEQN